MTRHEDKDKGDNMKNTLQHHLNPLHVYCRLIECGLGRSIARRIVKMYEVRVYVYVLG